MKKILVFFGGKSVEHDISVITALQVMKNISGYEFLPIYIKPNGEMVTADNLTDGNIYLNYEKLVKNQRRVLLPCGKGEVYILKKNKIKQIIKPYCALLCCHGHGGEDGSLQGLLEMCDIPYSSSSHLSSSLTMDKVFTKIVLEKNKVLTPAYVHFNRCEYAHDRESILKNIRKLSYPVIVKPATGGSSVGISICTDENMITSSINNALEFDDKILVEKFVGGAKEFSCAVIKNGDKLIASGIWKVEKGDFFTFEEKYLERGGDKRKNIPKRLQNKITNLAKSCYKALECSGVVRVDFLMNDEGLFVGEVNSIPGSLAFNLFPYPFSDLISTLVEEGRGKWAKRSQIKYTFSSSAIERFLEEGGGEKK